MEVILLQDVKSLGKKGDKVTINDGYARNYILPKKIGIEATPKNLNELKLKKANEEKRKKEIYEEAKAFAELINKKPIVVKIKSGEGGKTFGSISTKEIATAVKEQFDIDIDRKKLQLSDPIKSAGSYTIVAKLHPQVSADLKIVVEAL